MNRSALLLVLASMIAMSAQAGELLKFRRGTLETKNLTVPFSQFASEELTSKEVIVQFKNKITAQDKAWLKKNQVNVLRYIPDDAFIVKISQKEFLKQLSESPRVQGVVAYSAAMKISPDMSLGSVFNQNQISQVVVQFFSDKNAESSLEVIKKMSPYNSIIAASGKAIVLKTTQAQILKIAELSGVELIQTYIEMNSFVVPFQEEAAAAPPAEEIFKGDYTDLSGFETGTRLMKLEQAWDRGFTGKDQIVAMADTGLDTGVIASIHPDFAGGITFGKGYGAFTPSWEDPMGHGTHVAGSIMGRGTASGGILKGAAYESSMVAQGMWSQLLGGLSVPPKMAKMFDDAYVAGARIHSNSWGGGRNLGAYDAFAQQADDYMWKHPDFLLVFAAGNSGEDLDKDGRIDGGSVSSPGTAKNVLTVGASENTVNKGGIQAQIKEMRSAAKSWSAEPIASDFLSNNENGMACFSSRGPTTDGRIKPEISAPGTNVLSVFSRVPGAEKLWGEYNQDYVFSGGTSMSTPLTSGALAIAKQYLEQTMSVTTPSAALLKAYIMNTAFDMYPGQFGEVGPEKGQELLKTRPNSDEGFGRVDMDKATRLNSAHLIIADEKTGLALGEEKTYELHLAKDSKVALNLVYTDAPGSPQAAKVLVNNLNVEIAKDGQVVSVLADDTNNFEFFEGPLAAGIYQVKVKGQNIPQGIEGKQAYALVISHE